MKSVFSLITAALLAGTAIAQDHEHIHIFHTSKQFETFKGTDIESISFDGARNGYNRIIIKLNDSSTKKYNLSSIDNVMFRTTALPEIHVDLIDYPEWTELQGSKSDIRAATLYMDGNGMYDDLEVQEVEFRGRGNSSWGFKKKPYRFKMNKKASVCGLPKAKSFALIANYLDCSQMRNAIALWLANYFEMPYANHCIPVKVYLNGINKGQYMLTEKIGIGGGSVDIDETKGMLFELDSYYDEDFKFTYKFTKSNSSTTYRLPVMVKDPDLTELAEDPEVTNITNANEYLNLWKEDFTKMADAITKRAASESLSDVIDLEDAVNFFLVNSLANNHEMNHPKSLYIYKKSLDAGEVYHFGPVWDFDWAFTFSGSEGASAMIPLVTNDGDYSGATFFKLLFANTEFRKLFKAKFDDFVKNGYPMLKEFMEEYATLIEPTSIENGVLWPEDGMAIGSYNFRSNFETLKKWIEDRINYMSFHSNFGLY